MYEINFKAPCAIHFIGIGGISMSGLAQILMNAHFTVSGSDACESKLTKHLIAQGAAVYYGHRADNISPDTQVVIYTAAIHDDNPEIIAAKKRNIPLLTRAKLLGQIMKNYKTSIGVSGTHGKTTTTSMISQILLLTDKDPTISVGGVLPAIGGNIRVGSHEIFLTEACEYTNSFLSFFPTIEIILNIEADHLDFFKDLNDIRNSFHKFAKLIPNTGMLIINGSIDNISEIIGDLNCKIITFGEDKSYTYSADNITFDELARPSFDLIIRGKKLTRITLGVTGKHNVYNALSAIALCLESGIDIDTVKTGLLEFTGTDRRFQKKGIVGGVTIIDDYAHHPAEITATLKTAKHYPHKKLWCVFQPHTYTRTKAFLGDFAKALSYADEVILADIYAARETDTLGISSKDIADKIDVPVHHFHSFDEIENFLLENCKPGDLVITMGAGDIVKVGEALLG